MGMDAGAVERVAPWAWSLALAVLLLGGALGPGYVLTYDMVWVPDLAARSDFLGLGSSLPRAVPSDLVVALLDEIVPGMLLQKVVLVAALTLAGVGAWRLVPRGHVLGHLAAATLYVWNPFVAERLGIGHWPLLMTYAALPWIHLAARGWVRGERGPAPLILWIAFASLSPVGGLIAGTCAVLSVGIDDVRRLAWTTAILAALNAPWIVAGALHGAGAVSDRAGVEAFAAHQEGPLPLPLTLLGLGGIWNAEVVPASRTTWIGAISLTLMVAVCAYGVREWRRRSQRRDSLALVAMALLGLGVALSGALLPGVMGWLGEHVPGAGLLRDSSRFVALLAPLEAATFGVGVARLTAWGARGLVGLSAASALAVVPIALMPDAALGLSGRLDAVDYPEEYAAARAMLVDRNAAEMPGDLLALPFTSYRRPEWNDSRRTLDPIGRYFPVDYLASDELVVSGVLIPGEDARARRVADVLEETEGEARVSGLREEGIGWIVLDKQVTPGLTGTVSGPRDLPGVVVLHEGEALSVFALPEEGGTDYQVDDEPARLIALVLAWTSAAMVLSAAACAVARRRLRSVQMP